MAIEDLLNQLRANDRGGRIDVSKLSPEQRAQVRQHLIAQREAEAATQRAQSEKLGRASQRNVTGTGSSGLRDFDSGRFSGPVEQVPMERLSAARMRTDAAYAEPVPPAPKNVDDVYVERYAPQQPEPVVRSVDRTYDTSGRTYGQPSLRAYPGEKPATPVGRFRRAFQGTPETPSVAAGGTNFVDVPEKPQLSLRQRAEFDTAVGLEQEAIARKQQAAKGLAQAKPGSTYAAKMQATLDSANADIETARGLQTEVQTQPRTKASVTDTVANATTSKQGAKQAANDVEAMAKQKLNETIASGKQAAQDIADKAPEVKRGVGKVRDKIVEYGKKVTQKGLGGKKSEKASKATIATDLPDDVPNKVKVEAGAKFARGMRTGINVFGAAGMADMTESVIYDLYHNDGNVRAVYDKYRDSMSRFIEAKQKEVGEYDAELAGLETTPTREELNTKGLNYYNPTSEADKRNIGKRSFLSKNRALGTEQQRADELRYNQNVGKLLWDTIVIGAVAAIPSLYKKMHDHLSSSPLKYGRDSDPFSFDTYLPGLESTPTRADLNAQGLAAPAAPATPAPPPPPPIMGGPDADMSLPPEAVDPGIATSDLGGGKVGISGLRGGGFGAIDATNAPGGAEGFRSRVNQSISEGAYNPVSAERRAEAQADLGRVKRGIDAMRDLSATRLGVPVQYLDDVRAGNMTRREAALAGVRDEGLRSRYGDTPAELATAQAKLLEAQSGLEGTRSDQIERGQTFLQNEGESLGTQAYPNNPEKQAEFASKFRTFAQSKMPQGTRFDQLDATQQEELKGEFSLLDSLSRQGEGFFRSLNIAAPDITAENLTGTGQSILDTLRKQGTTFDFGDDNLNFTGYDTGGRPVQLTVEKEDLPPAARAYVERYISRLSAEERQARGGLRE